jgi:hypothetical protein
MRIYLVFDSESNSDARQVKAFTSAVAANRYYEQSQANEMLSVNVDGVDETARLAAAFAEAYHALIANRDSEAQPACLATMRRCYANYAQYRSRADAEGVVAGKAYAQSLQLIGYMRQLAGDGSGDQWREYRDIVRRFRWSIEDHEAARGLLESKRKIETRLRPSGGRRRLEYRLTADNG